jgi:hypothetical protein
VIILLTMASESSLMFSLNGRKLAGRLLIDHRRLASYIPATLDNSNIVSTALVSSHILIQSYFLSPLAFVATYQRPVN